MAKAKSQPKPKTKKEKHAGGRPMLFKTVKELQTAIDRYFESCWEELWHQVPKPAYAKFAPKVLASMDPDEVYEWKPLKNQRGEIIKRQLKPYTIAALAIALGTTRETLLDYQERPEFSDTIKNAKLQCQAYAEEMLFEPKIAAGVIFNLKNNYGYKDRLDLTSDDKPMPVPIINVPRDN